ncbi:MAG TPA: UvrD-helicase domain-containing protein, partial [Bryobacteraceae bacterium]|nr:UvrD-helicase domain-containing protein [Bryobacteraceae bacterium]
MTPGAQADDRLARERIRDSLGESLIVEASAGTGKTSEMVRRIVRVLQTGLTTIDRIVAVTFTNKTAGELKLRLRQGLDEARQAAGSQPQEVANLEAALEHLEEASIGTIHAFCAQILRERPVEANVDPAFTELTEGEAGRIYERAFRGWIQRKLAEPSPGLRRALVRLAWRDSYNAGPPMEQIQESGRRLIEWRDFPAPWRRDPFDRETRADALVRLIRELAAHSARCRRPHDNLYKALEPARDLDRLLERAEAVRPRDYDTLESLLLKLERDLNRNMRTGSGFFADGLTRQEVLDLRRKLLEGLAAFRLDADADLAVLLRDEMQGLVDRYEDLKRRSGKLDFADLLALVRRLARGNAEVRRYLQERYTHLFVDEFQDTDPLQMEILLLLAADDPRVDDWQAVTPKPGKLFVVGDPKQSIYKFRRADVVLYRAVRDNLERRGVGVVRLTRSFRSVRPIQHCVNAA